MAITYIASTGRPGDNSTQGGNVTSPLLIAAAGATTGDLVIVIAQYRGNATIQLGAESAGQTWNSLTQFNDTGNLCAVRIFWCRWNTATYNGNDPNFDVVSGSSSIAFATVGHIFRPTTSTNVWAVDNAQANSSYAAPSTPFTVTITGVTPSHASSVAVACWFSEDDNTWGSLSGTGWNVAGDAQYRNTTGSDMSSSYAYKIQSSAAATGNVSKNQATLGGDAGATCIVSFYEASSGYTLPITTASYIQTNVAVGLLSARKLSISASAQTLTMNATGLLHGYKVVLTTTAYTLANISVGLSATRRVAITLLALTSTAISTGLFVGKKLTITTSSYSLSYQNVGLSVQRRAVISTGSYSATTISIGLRATRQLSISSGSFVLSMVSVGLNYGLRLPVSPIALTLTNKALGLLATRTAPIAPAIYTTSTVAVSLRASRMLPVNKLQLLLTANNVNLNYGSVTNYSLLINPLALALIQNNINLLSGRVLPVNSATFSVGANAVVLSFGKRLSIDTLTSNILYQNAGLLFNRLFDIDGTTYTLTNNDISFLISSVNSNQVVLLQSNISDILTTQSTISNSIAEASNITQLITDNSGILNSQQHNSPIITTN